MRLNEEEYEAVCKLYDFSKKYANEISWGTGSKAGSFIAKFYSISKRNIYTVTSDGKLTISFGYLNDNENALRWREEFFEKLKQLEWLKDKVDLSKQNLDSWLNIPIDVWRSKVDEVINLFKDALKLE